MKLWLPTRSLCAPESRPSFATITPCPGSVASPVFVIAGALITPNASGSISGAAWVPHELVGKVLAAAFGWAAARFRCAGVWSVRSGVIVACLNCGPEVSGSPTGTDASGMISFTVAIARSDCTPAADR